MVTLNPGKWQLPGCNSEPRSSLSSDDINTLQTPCSRDNGNTYSSSILNWSSSGVEQQCSEGWVHGTGGAVRLGNRLPRPSEASAAEDGRERGGRDARTHQSEGRHVYSADRHLTRAVTWKFYQNKTCDIIQAPAPENYLHVFLWQMPVCYWRDTSRVLLDRLNATSSYFNPNPKSFF